MKKMKREIKDSAGATKIENACQAKDKDMATMIEPFGRALCKDPKVKEESVDSVAAFRKKVANEAVRMPRELPDVSRIISGDDVSPRDKWLLEAACKIAQDGDYELKDFSNTEKTIALASNLQKALVLFENARTAEIKSEVFKLVADFQENPYRYEDRIESILQKDEDAESKYLHCIREDAFLWCLPETLRDRLFTGFEVAEELGCASCAYGEDMTMFWRKFTALERHIISLYCIYDFFTFPVDDKLGHVLTILGSDYKVR